MKGDHFTGIPRKQPCWLLTTSSGRAMRAATSTNASAFAPRTSHFFGTAMQERATNKAQYRAMNEKGLSNILSPSL
ncbi:MAG: hypothetical protein IPI95_12695 [Flavobacteriales bacterium]|nr:hypothetical protein [Flavobacteriales bacterium]